MCFLCVHTPRRIVAFNYCSQLIYDLLSASSCVGRHSIVVGRSREGGGGRKSMVTPVSPLMTQVGLSNYLSPLTLAGAAKLKKNHRRFRFPVAFRDETERLYGTVVMVVVVVRVVWFVFNLLAPRIPLRLRSKVSFLTLFRNRCLPFLSLFFSFSHRFKPSWVPFGYFNVLAYGSGCVLE